MSENIEIKTLQNSEEDKSEYEFKNTHCQSCGTKKRPLFMMSPPQHSEDIVCEPCRPKLIQERVNAN